MCFCSIVFAFIVCGLCISHVNQVKVSALFVSKAIKILFRNNYTTSVGGKNRGSIIERTSQCCQPAERAIIVCHRECMHTNTHTHVHTFCVDPKWCWINSTRGSLFIGGAHTHKHTNTQVKWTLEWALFSKRVTFDWFICVYVCVCAEWTLCIICMEVPPLERQLTVDCKRMRFNCRSNVGLRVLYSLPIYNFSKRC